ncbi:hypothetical protein WJX77_003041 [Trebouxia sp. C0004]
MTQASSICHILSGIVDSLLQSPRLGRSVVTERTLRVIAVGATAVHDAWDTLPGHFSDTPLGFQPLLYYYVSGRCEDKSDVWFDQEKTTQHMRFQRASEAERDLWNFVFSEQFRAAVKASDSPFLHQILATLDKFLQDFQVLCQEHQRQIALMQSLVDFQHTGDIPNFFVVSDQLDKLAEQTSEAQKLSRRADFKKKVTQSTCQHFCDAEIQWLYSLLHNSKLRAELCAKFAQKSGPITLILHTTKAPCDLCAMMIVLKYPELVKRFDAAERGLEIIVSSSADYGEAIGCVGLAKLSEGNKHITFCYLDRGIDAQLDKCKLGFSA